MVAWPANAGVYLDFAAERGAFGGYLRLENQSFWAGVVGMGNHPLIALRDDDLPRHRGFEVRTDGLWVAVTCETPDEHWSVGMEAFAVGYDDPAGALGDERGDIVALGFDLEWERAADDTWHVHGDVLVDDTRRVIDVTGMIGDDAPARDAALTSPRWIAPVKSGAATIYELSDDGAWSRRLTHVE